MPGLPLYSLRDLWNNTVDKYPRKTAVIFAEEEHTYAECDALSARVAAHLQSDLGVQKGDRVSFLLSNCFEFYLGYWAAVRLGAVVAPVNIRLSEEEMGYVLRCLSPRVLLVHAEHQAAAEAALRGVEPRPALVSVGYETADAVPFPRLLTGEGKFTPPDILPEDLAVIAHTSGTTGLPKGAMMRHTDLLFNLKNTIIPFGFRHEDVHLLVVPLFHATGLYSLVPSSCYLGSTLVMAPRPDPREVVELIAKHRITTFLSVPTFFYFVTHLPDLERYDLRCLRVIGYAGSPMPVQTIRRLHQKFPWARLHNFFGLTETISLTHIMPAPNALTHAESIGKVIPDVGAKIFREDGTEAEVGEVGRLHIHRSAVIQGYWNRPGLLEESLTPDGEWFDTGDLAREDEEGFVYLHGRTKEMIIVAGENVFALEVERTILEHPRVREVAVVGVPATGVRAYLGELVKAVVVPQEGANLTPLEIKRFCAQRLASYKVPQIVEFRPALPRNPSGKVLKRELQ
ncbi:MAG TPA: hypothetical protein EYP85_08875 [Armatimonadetes bacterium]|nr:hypothetical protein [Armatimonadota bacterium]